jgi:hypothetical protein
LDSDGDGVSNAQEYLAGTDPQDPRSFLRIDRLGVSGPATLSFTAVGARSYSVEFTDSLGPADWQRLAEVPGRATNDQAVVTDPASNPRRYYRLVTPAQP